MINTCKSLLIRKGIQDRNECIVGWNGGLYRSWNRALQIFEKDLHPNVHQKRTKESLSLFGMHKKPIIAEWCCLRITYRMENIGVLDHTISPLGRHLLKLWLQRPTLDMETLHGRHRAVEIFIRPESTSTVKEIKSSLSHVKNIARILSRIRENQANPTEWQQLLQVNQRSMACSIPRYTGLSLLFVNFLVCFLLSAHPCCGFSAAVSTRHKGRPYPAKSKTYCLSSSCIWSN